ncbi:MAG TPA: metalloregulator ArsR/SmtB family transcription factor [Gaiellales bacterium]|jgi:DNA-binding transcriptional ArsR family regulator|nr:metalloregulator ArsR/SmtB family transcription factor [Gaiellales bacterium]
MLYQCRTRDRADRVFRALADPHRRAIVERLSRGPASVTELAQPLPMSLPAVTQHLQVLERSGLVRSSKVGRVRTCRMEPDALRPVERWIGDRRSSWERRLDRLGGYLSEEGRP